MTNDLRSQTSPANGAKSNGPKTEAGKRRSSRNSNRHNLLANTIVLDAENRKDFLKTLDSLRRDFNPQDHFEESLVETMAVARWRLFRLWTVEKAGLSSELSKHELTASDFPSRAANAYRGLTDESRWNDCIGRHETRFDRQYLRAASALRKWRIDKQTPEKI